MSSRTIHSNKTPKQFVQGYRSERVICRKVKGGPGYEVVQPSFPKEWEVLAWGATPMQAWWEAANVR
jgi:hypothetical protein